MEDALATLANRVLICDTDPFATSIWHERYMGQPSDAVREIANSRSYDLYIVTDANIPFVQDDIRDSEPLRQWMQGRFIEELARMPTPMIVVSGPHEERFAAAVRRIDELLGVTTGLAAGRTLRSKRGVPAVRRSFSEGGRPPLPAG